MSDNEIDGILLVFSNKSVAFFAIIFTPTQILSQKHPRLNLFIFQTYVQDLIMRESAEICSLIKHQKAHIYVCGDVQMAENVYQTLR